MTVDEFVAKAQEGIQRSVDLVGCEHIPQGLKDLSQALDIIEKQRKELKAISMTYGTSSEDSQKMKAFARKALEV